MHISNRFVMVCNIQIVIRMLKNIDHSITSLNTEAIYGKIGSRLQIALFFSSIEIFVSGDKCYVNASPKRNHPKRNRDSRSKDKNKK